MKKTIFSKLFILFIAFSFAIVGLLWFLQANFFTDFYEGQKINQMKLYVEEIEDQIKKEGFSYGTQENINDVASILNGSIRIMDARGRLVYQTGTIMGITRVQAVPGEIWERVYRGEGIIYKLPGDMRRLDTLALIRPIDNHNYYIILQTPIQPIEEAISIAQQFNLYILMGGLILAMILSLVFSKTITSPLIKLNKVVREMGDLNFDSQWDDPRQDEIGQLGETFNFLSNELKITFNELQEELNKEKNLDKMRKQFVARVSHELQTPIALIQGYTEALQDGVATNEEEKEEYYHIIEEEIDRMSTMVKDLLDLSQLESGNFKVDVELFEIAILIDRLLFKFDVLVKEKSIHLQIKGDLGETTVLGDEYRIEQVLSNLIQNAISHTGNEGKIEISLKDLGERIWIGVFNEGPAIKEDDLSYIWESFYKEKDKKIGTGLGLAIVRSVLELHGSQYGVENVEGGVLFFFDIKKSNT
ncbi:sensor histidine kinase [Alkaliphilus transvaalensis]|uniref:sensor histidine kinase n=1 Tax=Alkaliphilus transvaalensis TaxID=114628 RepID=UPI000478F0B5|nr:HAMP domain-containing sensor histidine kinase [Alkaliphilus transvaalensis]